jgi:UDP-N-acetylmuramoyl-tripeptide--D-alanyl-D-alanine ligase
MIKPLSLSRLAQRFGGTLFRPDCSFESVSIDSRTIEPGDLFVALRGDRFDGHRFLPEVATQASGLVVEKVDVELPLSQWVVADTTTALGDIARMARDDYDGKLIALTGSSGKTSVKEMIAAILARCGATLATKGNLNNHIGVPLTLLSLDAAHRYAVIEMGASGPGEIAYLAAMARPDVALVNNVMPAHVGGFGSLAVIAETKGAIYQSLPPAGTAVINLDESWSRDWRNNLPCSNCLTFALDNPEAEFTALNLVTAVDGSRFDMVTPAGTAAISLPLPGRHNVANSLAAAACAYAAGASLEDIVDGLAALQAVKGRLVRMDGFAGCTLIDDSYNANPGSVKAAIDVLAGFAGHRALVLGDMAELGDDARKLHLDVGIYALEKGIDTLWLSGEFAVDVARGFGANARVFGNKDELVTELKPVLGSRTTVLVKGSRSAAMEAVVKSLSQEDADASMAS